MLDKETLSQLSKLKADIHASRDFAEGVVASTAGRFGFVRLDDGRDAYLSPEKMQRVLPGDRVRVELLQNKEGKLEARLEKLIRSDLKRFVANYHVKGNAHFVEPVDSHINRWIFVPPKNRYGAKENEVLVARVTQHPWKDGKAQAKVLETLGKPEDAFYELRYTCAKYALNLPAPKKAEAEIKDIVQRFANSEFGVREDLTELDFVTIDSASTRDMDDALTIEKTDSGFVLHVAIADPSDFIDPESMLASVAEKKAQTLYLCGGVLPMLPEELANNYFSLLEGENRPALVCKIELDEQARVTHYEFKPALIRSRHKLSYDQVHSWLSENGNAEPSAPQAIKAALKTLHALATQRVTLRQQQHLHLNDDQMDYQFILDDQGKISEIVKREKLLSHQVVEECMLLTNICAGDFLANKQSGLHTVNNGFRADRIGEARALLKEENIASDNIEELEGFCELLRALAQNEQQAKLIPALKRMTENSRLDNKSAPHMSMGFKHYATVTSPIRRYADLYNHWKIREILNNKLTPNIDDARIDALNENLQNGKQADRELKQTLIMEYAQARLGQQGEAIIRVVTPQGFGARFVENGIDGFVLFDKNTEKEFDAKRLTMKVGDEVYHVGKAVEVKMVKCDQQKKRIAFELV